MKKEDYLFIPQLHEESHENREARKEYVRMGGMY